MDMDAGNALQSQRVMTVAQRFWKQDPHLRGEIEVVTDGIGDRYQKETKYHCDRMSGGGLDWARQPELYKEYPGCVKIALPEPAAPATMSLDDAIRRRKSLRAYTDEPLDKARLSYLLWASTGIQRREQGHEFRTAPSAGALYPIETYLVVNNVDDLPPGVYHYSIRDHGLDQIKAGTFQRLLAEAALGQGMCAAAPVVFIWTAVFQRMKWKYKQRAYRYVYLDAGHIAENLALAAVSLDLGSCQIGALFDDEVNAIIDVDGAEESVIYMTVVGHPR